MSPFSGHFFEALIFTISLSCSCDGKRMTNLDTNWETSDAVGKLAAFGAEENKSSSAVAEAEALNHHNAKEGAAAFHLERFGVSSSLLHFAISGFQNSSVVMKVRLRKAFGRALKPGDPLPAGICLGEVASRYAIDYKYGLLGQGAFGVVYEAKDLQSPGENKAVKKVKSAEFDPIELEPMRLKLPFVADVETVFKPTPHSTHVWIGTRLYHGGNLRDTLKAQWWGGFPLERIRAIGAQIAYGIWQVQRSGFIWGDLKPENVFLLEKVRSSEVPRIAIADFGISSKCEAPEECSNQDRGTAQYMSPGMLQLIKNKEAKYGFEVDWWAFGLTMWDMVVPGNSYGAYGGSEASDEEYKKSTFRNVLKGEPRWGYEFNDYPTLKTFLGKLIALPAHNNYYAHDKARQAMVSNDLADHPILSDPFWIGLDDQVPDPYLDQRRKDPSYRKKIQKFWKDLCREYSFQDCDADSVAPQPLCRVAPKTPPRNDACEEKCNFSHVKQYKGKTAEKTVSVCKAMREDFMTLPDDPLKACEAHFPWHLKNLWHTSPRVACCRCLVECDGGGGHCIDKFLSKCPAKASTDATSK
eukprot:gnl/MRDRNA2_/MRDRNA2_217451_c0_seq1.p1 gnl/MRDRNA2_/MRDRNA2_217451_c0~~gnl/MRDRNA2_/MRDRNA2_217451_c0_seq1.p1  ORF type:complete len:582 (+),score=105.93 gnl/MRDRNA2_/MRDRNA2_217451_c0_seq1:65-1810(+)